MPRYRAVRRGGFTFLFAYDRTAPAQLHIFVRHLTSIEDALGVWFDPDAEDRWDTQHQRFESRGATHVLLWTWRQGSDDTVLIISCFTRED